MKNRLFSTPTKNAKCMPAVWDHQRMEYHQRLRSHAIRHSTWMVVLSAVFAGIAGIISMMGCISKAHGAESTQSAPHRAETQRIDINLATQEQLMTLPNIGAKRAAAIIAYRSKHPFVRTSDIMRVRGIGRKRYAKLQPMIMITGPQPATTADPSSPRRSPMPPTAARSMQIQRRVP